MATTAEYVKYTPAIKNAFVALFKAVKYVAEINSLDLDPKFEDLWLMLASSDSEVLINNSNLVEVLVTFNVNGVVHSVLMHAERDKQPPLVWKPINLVCKTGKRPSFIWVGETIARWILEPGWPSTEILEGREKSWLNELFKDYTTAN